MSTLSETPEAEQRPLGLRFVVDVLNDLPATGEDLQHLVRAHHGPHLDPGDFDADAFRQAADSVRRVFAAPDDVGASTAINTLLAKVAAPTQLDRLDDGRWVLRPAAAPSPALWFAATAAFGLGLWMTERGRAAWGVCAAGDCARVFVDAGRRSPQQYCSARCATRVRVSAHRESARAQGVGSRRPTIS